MKRMLIRGIQFGLLASILAVMGTGCASSTSTKATALKPEVGASVDLSKYQTATVLPFTSDANIDPNIGEKFADEVARRLQYDFGPIFKEVRKGPQLGKEDELIVTGVIREYKPGDPFARAMMAGVGAAHFKGDLILKDGADNRVLLSAPISKLWAWGGIMGASKGIKEMVTESEAAVASTIAQAKGWKPPSKESKTK